MPVNNTAALTAGSVTKISRFGKWLVKWKKKPKLLQYMKKFQNPLDRRIKRSFAVKIEQDMVQTVIT